VVLISALCKHACSRNLSLLSLSAKIGESYIKILTGCAGDMVKILACMVYDVAPGEKSFSLGTRGMLERLSD
jgi:hypothetical protein